MNYLKTKQKTSIKVKLVLNFCCSVISLSPVKNILVVIPWVVVVVVFFFGGGGTYSHTLYMFYGLLYWCMHVCAAQVITFACRCHCC